ncbi:MAG: hypothetical protein JXA87_02370 [Thermoleophilia bacterium]|nr:hypothetical protein [Thermoleophilia bacterium]
MADIYTFRCPGCGYEARVAGGPTATSMHYYETIVCRDCKELRDVAFAVRDDDGKGGGPAASQAEEPGDPVLDDLWAQYYREFEEAKDTHRPVNVRLIEDIHAAMLAQQAMLKQSNFRKLDAKCPKSAEHAWESWRHPGPCPQCGKTMERGHWVPGKI